MGQFKTVYTCQQCGNTFPVWSGQCPNCHAWNSLVEEVVEKMSARKTRSTGGQIGVPIAKIVKLSDLQLGKDQLKRSSTGSAEFDRVLGGGMVPGSVILLAGEPGIGKSTLLTQLAMSVDLKTVLYVCGEESPEQVGLRIRRLRKSKPPNVLMLPSTDVDEVVAAGAREKPEVMIVDSIQTLTTGDLVGMAGSVGQVRESANRLIGLAKSSGTTIFLVGHVTKEGSVAGPKVLEHMVDVVVTLEGERTGLWRLLRSIKNRFGATDEVGVLTMAESGMVDVPNPSGAFLEESQIGSPGSAVVTVLEGSRPVLVEVQALTVETSLPVPRRVAQGIPVARLQLIVAILQKHARLQLGSRDIYVNVAGGLKISEPAADLGIALAIASSFTGKAIPKQTVVVGEVGLLGEVRRVASMEKRLKEAKKLGFPQAISPTNFNSIRSAVTKLLK